MFWVFVLIFTSISFLGGFVVAVVTRGQVSSMLDKGNHNQDKFRMYFSVLDKWMSIKEQKKGLDTFFLSRGYKNIVIYGLGKLGYHLIEELKNSSITVLYCLDRNADVLFVNGVEVKTMDDILPNCDVVIVTPICEYEKIKTNLEKKLACPVISLRDIFAIE